jgi:nanoRNase/pAp phosphatase (c-di-AMP/oligoRNAs hydrolase)
MSQTPLSTVFDDQEVEYGTFDTLLSESDSLLVVCHDHPDPDCLSSALALSSIGDAFDISATGIGYGGGISHQQNRAMVNALDIDLTPVENCSFDEYELVAFVDHSVPDRNDSVPDGFTPDIVIDHHPSDQVNAEYVDVRPRVGSTATLLTRYIEVLDVGINERIATALLFGIHRETLNFVRGATASEHAAACTLRPTANKDLINTLSNSVFTPETLDGMGNAILNRNVRGSCLVSFIGQITERDILPQAADYLLQLEGISTTAVYGIVADQIHLSARTSNSRLHIGDLLDEAFGDIGSAGGHQDMAGGQLPVGLLGEVDTPDNIADDLIDRSVRKRLFGTLDEWTG